MKTTLHNPSSIPTKPIKQDPFQRLSRAVKKLDQLINRAHQLGTFTDQLLRKDATGPSITSSKATPTQALPSISGGAEHIKKNSCQSKET